MWSAVVHCFVKHHVQKLRDTNFKNRILSKEIKWNRMISQIKASKGNRQETRKGQGQDGKYFLNSKPGSWLCKATLWIKTLFLYPEDKLMQVCFRASLCSISTHGWCQNSGIVGSHCYDKTTEMSKSSKINHESKEPENHLQTKAKPWAGDFSCSKICSLEQKLL